MHGRVRPQDLPDRPPQAFAAIEHDQEPVGDLQPAVEQVAEEGGAGRRILGAGLDKPQQHLLAAQRDAQRDHQRVLGKPLPIEDQGDHVIALQAPLLQGSQCARRGADIAPGDAGAAEPEGLGHRLGRGPVIAAAQAVENAPEHAFVRGAGLLELGVALQRDLDAGVPIPHPRHLDGEFLISEIDRAMLPAPPDPVWRGVPASVPRAGQRLHFLVEDIFDRLQTEWNQRLDERDAGVEILGPAPPPTMG